MKYEINFKGVSYDQRMIELYLPEYKQYQTVMHSPIIGCNHIFGFESTIFWRAHEDLNLEVKKILEQLAYKHLWWLMHWDCAPKDTYHTYEWWKFTVDNWIKYCSKFKPNEEEYKMCLNSFYNKYERIGKSRKYNFIEE